MGLIILSSVVWRPATVLAYSVPSGIVEKCAENRLGNDVAAMRYFFEKSLFPGDDEGRSYQFNERQLGEEKPHSHRLFGSGHVQLLGVTTDAPEAIQAKMTSQQLSLVKKAGGTPPQQVQVTVSYRYDWKFQTWVWVDFGIFGGWKLMPGEDAIGHSGVKTTSFTIRMDTAAPVVTTSDQHISLGETLKPEEFVTSVEDNDPESSFTYTYEKDPDWQKVGEQTIKLIVSDRSGNQAAAQAKLTIAGLLQLEVATKAGAVRLGQTAKTFPLEDWIQQVTLDGQSLPREAYDLRLVGDIDTSLIGEKTATLEVSLKKDPSVKKQVTTTVTVSWEQALVFGGIRNPYSPPEYRSVAAFMVQPGPQLLLTASPGNQIDNFPVHDYFVNKRYFRLDWFDLTKLSEKHISLTSVGEAHLEANGDELKKTVLARWQPQLIHYGDILRGWSALNSQFLMVDGAAVKHGKDNFYEITPAGLSLLDFNRLKPETQQIPIGVDQDYLADHLSAYLATSGQVMCQEFIRYPDTSRPGKTTGVIRVAETLASGKKVTFDYEVPFEVAQLKVTTQPLTQVVGATAVPELSQGIQQVTLNGDPIAPNTYQVTAIAPPVMDTVGESQVKVRVSLEAHPDIQTEVTIPLQVSWGHTILTMDHQLKQTAAALALLTDGQTPRLVAHRGAGFGQAAYVLARPTWQLYRQDLNQPYAEFSYGTVKQKPAVLMDHWNHQIAQTQALTYGDVISFSVNRYGDVSSNYLGANTWVSRGDQLVKETVGFPAAYYELTPAGFELLHINQLTPKQHTIHLQMTEEKLDQAVSSYLETIPNVEIVGFSQYPDTSQVGHTSGKIRVKETTSNGQSHILDYTVPFEVIDPTVFIDVELPTKMLFGSLDRDHGRIKSPDYQIKNHSTKKVTFTIQGAKIKNAPPQWQLLTPQEPDPVEKTPALRLQLRNKQSTETVSLYEKLPPSKLATLAPQQKTTLQLRGDYYGDYRQKQQIDLALRFGLSVSGD